MRPKPTRTKTQEKTLVAGVRGVDVAVADGAEDDDTEIEGVDGGMGLDAGEPLGVDGIDQYPKGQVDEKKNGGVLEDGAGGAEVGGLGGSGLGGRRSRTTAMAGAVRARWRGYSQRGHDADAGSEVEGSKGSSISEEEKGKGLENRKRRNWGNKDSSSSSIHNYT